MAKLVAIVKNEDYFKTSKIQSRRDADNIINAINKGALILEAPLLSIRKANAIAIPCSLATIITVMAATKEIVGKAEPRIALATEIIFYYIFSDYLKKVFSHIISHSVVRCLTCNNFDPFHTDPLQSAEQLRGKIKCPIFIQANRYDKILESPDEDLIKLYSALIKDNTHIYISPNGSHNSRSRDVGDELRIFNSRYFEETYKVQPSRTLPISLKFCLTKF